MRTITMAAITTLILTAPAWAHGAAVQVRTPVYGVSTIAVGEPHGHYHHHSQRCQYMSGHYETVYDKVWVPGHYRQSYVPPVYKQKYVHGVTLTVLVAEGYTTNVWVPGHYKTVTRQIWRDGFWGCGY